MGTVLCEVAAGPYHDARSLRCLQRAGSCLQRVSSTEEEVRKAILRKQDGKSTGFDHVPVELLEAGGDKMVLLLCSLFMVSSSKAVYRRGFRALGCAHCGKAKLILVGAQTIVAFRSATWFRRFCWKLSGHELSAGYNAYLLFADLERAWSKVVRDMAVGCRCTEADLANQLEHLGLVGDDLQWRLDVLRSGSVLQAGMEVELVDLVECRCTGTWFCVQEGGLPSHQTLVVESRCGGRQGCK